MSAKLTIQDCRQEAQKRGGACLSEKYGTIQSSYIWRCAHGHEWSSTFAIIKQGSWCPICAKKVKGSIQKCHDLAKSRGGYCLSKEYLGSKKKYTWKCSEGHVWEATHDSVSSKKSWCPYCSNRKIKNIDACQKLAKERKGKFLSTKYINAHTKYTWKCKKGHVWEATYNRIEQGDWCPRCNGKINLRDCFNLAHSKKGKCLSEKYVNTTTKILWECKYGHQWKSSLSSVKYKNLWCPYCQGFNSKRHPPNINDCIKLAKSKNGKFLSSNYINSRSKYLWECNKGHQWMATYNSVQQGYWCSKCKASKKQKKLFNIVKNLYPNLEVKFNYKGFDWLRTCPKGTMELDIYVPDLKLAIEYDGEQHFMPVKFGNMSYEEAKKAFLNQKKRDKIKNNLVERHTDDVKYFLRFRYDDNLSKDSVQAKIFSIIYDFS